MRLVDYFAAKKEEGVSLTAAVRELADITGAGVRSVWRWVDGGEVPPYAQRLLSIWGRMHARAAATLVWSLMRQGVAFSYPLFVV